MSDLICPKCHGAMRGYERSGITVDQCADCRGIFLDRGELERLVDAENRWHGGQSAPPPPPPPGTGSHQPPPPPGYGHDRGYGSGGGYRQGYGSGGGYRQGYGSGGGYRQGHGHRRKRSFLDDLFD
ncbi:TFIIB-type zinc ribbon-containing protein [Flindersiella endophytica]